MCSRRSRPVRLCLSGQDSEVPAYSYQLLWQTLVCLNSSCLQVWSGVDRLGDHGEAVSSVVYHMLGPALNCIWWQQLKSKKYRSDTNPIENECKCSTCMHFSRAYLHCLATKEQTGARLVTIHNIAYMMRLGERMREAIRSGTFPDFVVSFFKSWVCALFPFPHSFPC